MTVAHQAPLSMGFPRHGYWSGLPFPFPRDLPDPRMKPVSLASPALAFGFLTTEPSGKPHTVEMHSPYSGGRESFPKEPFKSKPPKRSVH